MRKGEDMISFQDVTLQFNGNYVFRDLNLTIKEHEKIVIDGRSGTGKTMLLYLLLGFVRPEQGKIVFQGSDIHEKNIWDVRSKIAYVGQDSIIGTGQVKDAVESVFHLKANAGVRPDSSMLNDMLAYLDLNAEILEKRIEDLSSGERQRIAITIAVLLKRNIFLLDETTSALDRALKQKVADFFVNLKDSTVIAVSHDSEWLEHGMVTMYNLEEKRWRC